MVIGGEKTKSKDTTNTTDTMDTVKTNAFTIVSSRKMLSLKLMPLLMPGICIVDTTDTTTMDTTVMDTTWDKMTDHSALEKWLANNVRKKCAIKKNSSQDRV